MAQGTATAFDYAIADEVDFISFSWSLGGAVDFSIDSIAIGAVSMQRGILNLNSAVSVIYNVCPTPFYHSVNQLKDMSAWFI